MYALLIKKKLPSKTSLEVVWKQEECFVKKMKEKSPKPQVD